jgi:hypothetical protein
MNGSEKKSLDGNNHDIDVTLDNIADDTYSLQIIAKNNKGKNGESTIRIGVNKPWDAQPTPTSVPATPAPTSILPTTP